MSALTPEQYDEDILEAISNKLSDGLGGGWESWVEGKTLTVMMDAPGERRFVKLRLARVTLTPSAADMRGTPE